MRRLFFASTVVALCSCASPSPDSGYEPVWSQRPEERGRLPVGHVTSVERIDHREPTPLAAQASAGSLPGAGLSASTSGVIASTTGASGNQVYRYTLRMSGGATRQAEAEHSFKVGDCVAIRSGSGGRASLVSALAEECR